VNTDLHTNGNAGSSPALLHWPYAAAAISVVAIRVGKGELTQGAERVERLLFSEDFYLFQRFCVPEWKKAHGLLAGTLLLRSVPQRSAFPLSGFAAP
jgi:hypothetical protein